MNAAVTFDRPDAVVVGSGAGGSTASRVLTQRGWNVTVLEKGPSLPLEHFSPFDELHFREHKALIPKRVDDPMIYAGLDGNSPTPSERWWEATMVGGSTMIWDGNFPRYTPEDFDVLPFLADMPNAEHMVRWPWTYQDFLPHFERAEHEWGVSGDAEHSPEWMRPGYRYPMPPLKPHASTQFLTTLFQRAGLQPYVGARAINSQTYDGRPACPFCGFCQFFGCIVNCRANAVNTMLHRALATGRCDLRPNHYVVRIEHQKRNGRRQVSGVWYVTEPGGTERFLPSRRVIVSVQTIQSARLFLLSELPNRNDLIGRFLTYHTKGDGHFTWPGKRVWDPGPASQQFQPVTAIGSLQLRGLYTYRDPEGRTRKAGKFSVYDPFTCTTPIRLVKAASLGPERRNVWGADLVRYLTEIRSQAGVSVSFTGDAMSRYENRVELDPQVKDPWGVPVARTYYRHDLWDLAMSRFALDTVARIVTDAGGEVRRLEPQEEANPGYGHVHGALRAGTDPDRSVLDPDCQSHEVEGLYVLDAAWMPTAGASNPSLTLIANAFRVSERIPKAASRGSA